MRISDWSSDVCSSDLQRRTHPVPKKTYPACRTIGSAKTVVLKIAERHQAFEQDRSARLRPFQRSGYFGNAGFALNRVKILEDTQNPARRFNDRWFADRKSTRLNSSH